MTTQNDETQNPLIPDLARVEAVSRGFLVNTRRTLKPIERELRKDPETSAELSRAGGFPSLLTRNKNQKLERDYLSRFSNMQTSLFVDRLTQGDLTNTPALETMYESSRQNNKILTSIAQELDSCCGEIKKKLDDIDAFLRTSFRKLRDLILNKFFNLQEELNVRFDRLESHLEQSTTFLEEEIKKNNTELFVNLKNEIKDNSLNVINALKTTINESKQEIIDKIQFSLNNLQTDINRSFSTLVTEITELLAVQTSTLTGALELFYELTIQPVVLGIGSGVAEIVTTTGYLSYAVSRNYSILKSLPSLFDNKLNHQLEQIKTFLNDWKKDLIIEIAHEVSLHVVGESYYKWDSVSTYYPTITFLFKETETSQYPRRSQVKIRLNKKNQEITEKDIIILKTKSIQLLNQTYTYGQNRYNYVSKDKRFKTTLFGSDTKEIKNLLNNLLSIIDDPFEEKNLSLTINRNRQNLTKRQKSLSSIKPNLINYQTIFPLKLFKIVLLVNGMSAPLILAKS